MVNLANRVRNMGLMVENLTPMVVFDRFADYPDQKMFFLSFEMVDKRKLISVPVSYEFVDMVTLEWGASIILRQLARERYSVVH